MNIQPTPELEINKALYKDRSMPPHVRREQRIVWNLIHHLHQNGGWTVARVEDGETRPKVTSAKAAMELLFNLDDAWLGFSNTASKRTHYVRLIFGNDMDVISDWTFSEGDPDGFNAAMDKFDVEAYA